MKKIQGGTLLWGGAALLGLISLSASTAVADVNMTVTAQVISSLNETVTTNMDFGTIDLDPDGDTITIDASGSTANSGGVNASPASTVVGAVTAVTGGTSGLITITSAIDLGIAVTYPGDTPINGPQTVTLKDIDLNSGGGTAGSAAGNIPHTANIPTLIYVGGAIVFPAGVATGSYTGDIDIQLDYL